MPRRVLAFSISMVNEFGTLDFQNGKAPVERRCAEPLVESLCRVSETTAAAILEVIRVVTVSLCSLTEQLADHELVGHVADVVVVRDLRKLVNACDVHK